VLRSRDRTVRVKSPRSGGDGPGQDASV